MPRALSNKIEINPRRLKAVAYLLYGGLDPLHKRLPVAARTVAYQVQQGMVGEDVAEALQAELGEQGWAFVTGRRNELIDTQAA